ncbi:flagellin, partial [Undibacterium sp. 10I3]
DKAISLISSKQAEFGAIQNRLTAVITNMQTSSENITAAQSRIMDTDFAAETAKLTRAQILQQAGTAMLKQANSAPQSVLTLLQ